jgi:hypothetical protein
VFDTVANCVLNTVASCGTKCSNAVNCNLGSVCSTDSCVSGACQHTGTNAGAPCGDQADICDAPDYCDGVSPNCPNTYAARGTDCGYTTGATIIYNSGTPTNAVDITSGWTSYTITNAGPTTAWSDALKFAATSAAGAASRYEYVHISTTGHTFAATEFVEYDAYLVDNKSQIGGIDVGTASGYLRDAPANGGVGPGVDQNGIPSHPANDISARAYGKWYHRRFAMNGLTIVGKASTKWDVADENDDPSVTYTAYYDNIMVTTKAGACDGANACKVKTGAACSIAGDCASGVCTASVCQ